jgi:hypothetical protein
VDARGLRTNDDRSIERRSSLRSVNRGGSVSDASYASMAYLADLTGGRAFHNSNDLAQCLLAAVSDGDSTYSLDFYPDVPWDGTFHKLSLSVSRPGVKLRYRMGYFASKPTYPPAGAAGLQDALAKSQNLSAIGLAVGVSAQDGGYKLTIAVDPRELRLTNDGENKVGAIELEVLPCRADEHTSGGKVTKLNIRLAPAKYLEALRQGLRFTTSVQTPPGTQQIRIGVEDVNSGAVGTVLLAAR